MGKQTKTPDKKQRIVRKLNRRQSLAAKFQSAVDEWGFSNRRMKRRYQF